MTTWQLGGLIVGALAVVYGVGLQQYGDRLTPENKRKVSQIGGLALLVLAVLLFLLPLLGVY